MAYNLGTSRIDRSSRLPLYQQLYDILRDRIRQGEWEPGDLIPPEPELMDCYDVSRTTVRQTLDMLVNENLIYREQGRGTFVAHPTVEQALVRIISFTDDMRRRGREPGTVVLSSVVIPASGEIADRLEIEPGDELAYIKRLRLADGEAMSVEESHLVHQHCPGILDGDYASHSLRHALAERYDIHWSRATQTIRAIPAPAQLSSALSIPRRAPLLYIERVSYSRQNTPVEFLRIYYRSDRYVLYNDLQP
ncbi:MAG: GntR family transcriptional regulator [Anaerolineae bacterium]|jgi:GntR family transcriptional regulator